MKTKLTSFILLACAVSLLLPDTIFAATVVQINGVPLLNQRTQNHACDNDPNNGCAITSVAMVLQYYGMPNATPDNVFRANGNSCLVTWGSIKYSVIMSNPPNIIFTDMNAHHDYASITAQIRLGHPVIVGGPNLTGFGQHWVVVIGYVDGKYIANDPNGGRVNVIDPARVSNAKLYVGPNAKPPTVGSYVYNSRVFTANIDGKYGDDILGIGVNGEIYYTLSNGNGTFEGETYSGRKAFSPASGWFRTNINRRVFVGDINGDKFDDLIGIGDTGEIYYSLAFGNGSFGKETDSGDHAFAPSAGWFRTSIRSRVFVADINADGRDDLIGIGDDGKIYHALSNGNGTFQNETYSGRKAFSPAAGWFRNTIRERVFVANIDNKKGDDLIGVGDDGKIYYSLSNGDGTFGAETYSGRKALAPSAGWFRNDIQSRVFVADINKDGKQELLGVGDDGKIYYSLSNGDGTFGAETYSGRKVLPPNSGWFRTDINRRVFAADFNNDKATDLLGIGDDGKYYFSLSGGNGSFGAETYLGDHGFSPRSGWFI